MILRLDLLVSHLAQNFASFTSILILVEQIVEEIIDAKYVVSKNIIASTFL